MKIIVSGVTGFVGGEVLKQLLIQPKVTSVIALSRRELPKEISQHNKLKVLIHKDFKSWSEESLREIGEADACIWCLGIAMANMETQKLVNSDYTMAAVNAFATHLAPATRERTGKKFRFIYTSGAMVERDQNKGLWFYGEARKLRGRVETEVLQLSEESKQSQVISTFVARPASITSSDRGFVMKLFTNAVPNVGVDQLAAVMIDLAVEDRENGQRIWENNELRTRGAQVLKAA